MSKGLRPPIPRLIWRDADMEVALTCYPPLARMLPHHHETLGVSVVIAGLVEECVGADSRQAGVGAGVVKPAGTRHTNRFGPAGARLLGISLRGEVAGWWDRTAGLSRWIWVREMAALRAAVRLSRFAGAGVERPAELAESLLLGMADVFTRTGRLPGQPPPWLARVRDRLHAEPARVCRLSALAQEAGVHPVHLARAFRRHYGRTVTAYLHHLRVLAAAERLAAGDAPVARIAADAGFADHSHLCRVFGRALGVTPTDFRLTARG